MRGAQLAQGLSMRSRDFLEAARARGEGSSYIILMEILPNMLSLVMATFLSSAVYTVATAAGLQFLGLGSSNDITWGTMLHFAQQNGALWSGNALWALAPGGAVALLGAAFALLNYAFDELTNPALPKRVAMCWLSPECSSPSDLCFTPRRQVVLPRMLLNSRIRPGGERFTSRLRWVLSCAFWVAF